MKLVDMEMSEEESKEQVSPSEKDMPKYPYGLCLRLNDDDMEKLGIDKLPKVGEKFYIEAECEVSSVSAFDSKGGDAEASMGLQIVKMGCSGGEDDRPGKIYDKT